MRGLGCASRMERLAQLKGRALLMLDVEASSSVAIRDMFMPPVSHSVQHLTNGVVADAPSFFESVRYYGKLRSPPLCFLRYLLWRIMI